MRYLHLDPTAIQRHVGDMGLRVAICRLNEGSVPVSLVTAAVAAEIGHLIKAEIDDLFERSKALWGTRLPYFLDVSAPASPIIQSLEEAVRSNAPMPRIDSCSSPIRTAA